MTTRRPHQKQLISPITRLTWAYKTTAQLGLSPPESAVLVYLAYRDGRNCFPSTRLIAAETGHHRATVARALPQLEARGLIRRLNRAGQSNRYILAITTDNPQQPAAPAQPATEPTSVALPLAANSGIEPVALCDTPPPRTCRTLRHPLSHSATPPVALCDTNRKEQEDNRDTAAEGLPSTITNSLDTPRPAGWQSKETALPEDWKPDPVVNASLAVRARNIPAAFTEESLASFTTYYRETGRKSRSWNKLWQRWLLGDWAKLGPTWTPPPTQPLNPDTGLPMPSSTQDALIADGALCEARFGGAPCPPDVLCRLCNPDSLPADLRLR